MVFSGVHLKTFNKGNELSREDMNRKKTFKQLLLYLRLKVTYKGLSNVHVR